MQSTKAILSSMISSLFCFYMHCYSITPPWAWPFRFLPKIAVLYRTCRFYSGFRLSLYLPVRLVFDHVVDLRGIDGVVEAEADVVG